MKEDNPNFVLKEKLDLIRRTFDAVKEVDDRFKGPHVLTDRSGFTARCCGNVDGCKWCAMEALYSGRVEKR